MTHPHMPPGQIMLLLQIFVYVDMDDITQLNGSSSAVKFTTRLIDENLIEVDANESPPDESYVRCPFIVTERGRVLIEKICGTALPVLVETWT